MPKQWSDKEKQQLRKLHREGYSMKEIGRMLDRPPNGVIGMLHRMRVATPNDEALAYSIDNHAGGKFVRIRFKRHKPPTKAHPLVIQLIELMNQEQCSVEQMCKHVGMSRTTYNNWRFKHEPDLSLLIACFNYLGYDLVVRKKKDAED